MMAKNQLPVVLTVLDAVASSLAAASDYNKNDQVPPAVVLWPDKDGQWAPVAERLREKLPHFLTYGSYDKSTRTGPSIWLRCMLAQSLPGITYWPEGAVRSLCKKNYGFDPDKDGELAAGEQLGNRQGGWNAVWERFAESPRKYPKLPELLRKSKPEIASNLFVRRESWPQFNEEMESELRKGLLAVRTLKPADASKRIAELETEHGIRRTWVREGALVTDRIIAASSSPQVEVLPLAPNGSSLAPLTQLRDPGQFERSRHSTTSPCVNLRALLVRTATRTGGDEESRGQGYCLESSGRRLRELRDVRHGLAANGVEMNRTR